MVSTDLQSNIISALLLILTVVLVYFTPGPKTRGIDIKYLVLSLISALPATFAIWIDIHLNKAEFVKVLLMIWGFIWMINGYMSKRRSDSE